MGISLNPLCFLVRHRDLLKGSSIIVLGRQQINLQNGDATFVDNLFFEADIDYNFESCVRQTFADELFLKLGCSSVSYLDYSEYEGAQFLHDLNLPIQNLEERFDIVIDGGTLEHVFNIPTAFLNINHILKLGGSLLSMSPANNWLGHGMYQFSPELFWVGLGACGFDTKEVLIMVRNGIPRKFYSVPDTRVDGVRREIRIDSGIRTDIFAHSIKTHVSKQFDSMAAQQEDYKAQWGHR